jgi:hypothetical protein
MEACLGAFVQQLMIWARWKAADVGGACEHAPYKAVAPGDAAGNAVGPGRRRRPVGTGPTGSVEARLGVCAAIGWLDAVESGFWGRCWWCVRARTLHSVARRGMRLGLANKRPVGTGPTGAVTLGGLSGRAVAANRPFLLPECGLQGTWAAKLPVGGWFWAANHRMSSGVLIESIAVAGYKPRQTARLGTVFCFPDASGDRS